MILFTGGAYQDKLGAAIKVTGLDRPMVTEAEGASFSQLSSAVIVNHLHLYIRDRLAEGSTPEAVSAAMRELVRANPGVCLICNEMGSGVVPVDPADRVLRETVGRVCCELAALADEVYRVVCGIPVKIR